MMNDLILELMSHGNWIPVHRDLLFCKIERKGNFEKDNPFMSTQEASILCELINLWDLSNKREKTIEQDEREWFMCTTSFLEKHMNIGKKTQQRLINILTSNGFVEFRMIGNPARRYFSINSKRIQQAIMEGSHHRKGEFNKTNV